MTNTESPYGPPLVTPLTEPVASARPRRGLGVTALVLSLVPIVVGLIFVVIAIVAGATDDTGWAILGWAILGAYVVGPLGLILGGTGLGLGIAAAVKNRGRAAG